MEVWLLVVTRKTQSHKSCQQGRNHSCWGNLLYHCTQYQQMLIPTYMYKPQRSQWMALSLTLLKLLLGRGKTSRPRNYLVSTIEAQQQRALINCNTAHDMWKRLSAQYLRNAAKNQHVLQQAFFEYQYQPDHDVMTHIKEIEMKAAQLENSKHLLHQSK